MKSIIRKELKLLLKGKGNFFFLIAMPMLFIVLFGSVFSHVGNENIPIHYIDRDHSSVSRAFIEHMSQVKGFTVTQDTGASVSDQIQKIKAGKEASLLVIPAGFGRAMASGQSAQLEFYQDPTQDTVTGPIKSLLSSISSQYEQQHVASTLLAAGQSPAQVHKVLQAPISIQGINVSGTGSVSMLDQVVPGYTVMFVFFIIMSMMRSFLGERESGMLSRLLSTPMRPVTYLFGMWIPALIAVLIQCVVLLAFGRLVYHVDLGDLRAIALLVLCLGICGTGIGLAVSLLIRGENQGRGITMLISLGGAAVGGVWLPTELMPHAVQVIGHFTPQYWAQQGFQDVMIRGAHITTVWPSAGVLLAFGAAGLLVAWLRFGHFIKAAQN